MNNFESDGVRTTSIRITGGIQVVVPDDIRLITPFVLREQEDWFEDEIKFLRKWLRSGMNAIDIGANYGVYALMIAEQVGVTGQVLAIEPTASVLACLKKSIKLNNLSNIVPIEAAISGQEGEAQLAIYANNEKNTLHVTGESPLEFENVSVFTLDQCVDRYSSGEIDFIKIDAEGEEMNIIDGGHNTLTDHSPLVMYELCEGSRFNLDLIDRFDMLGYSSYRLIRGTNTLIPFDPDKPFDQFLLNLFCCKDDRATSLIADNIIVRDSAVPVKWQKNYWASYILKKTYAIHLQKNWVKFYERDDSDTAVYREILDLYSMAHTQETAANIRTNCLLRSLELIEVLVSQKPTILRLMSFMRILAETGNYTKHTEIAYNLVIKLMHADSRNFDLSEPFLAPSSYFDSVDPETRFSDWCLAAVLFGFERQRSYSAYFFAERSLSLLNMFKTLGFPSPEMERRRQLILMALGRQDSPEPSDELCYDSDYNLNSDYWCGSVSS